MSDLYGDIPGDSPTPNWKEREKALLLQAETKKHELKESELLQEARAEYTQTKRVYGRQLREGKISEERYLTRLAWILRIIHDLDPDNRQTSLF